MIRLRAMWTPMRRRSWRTRRSRRGAPPWGARPAAHRRGLELARDPAGALEAGDDLDVPLPSAHAADEVLTRAGELGFEHRDIAAMFQVLARMSARARH